MPLTLLDAPFRDITHPLLEQIRAVRGTHPRDMVTVVVPELVVGGYWHCNCTTRACRSCSAT